jgi:hypothetical protein
MTLNVNGLGGPVFSGLPAPGSQIRLFRFDCTSPTSQACQSLLVLPGFTTLASHLYRLHARYWVTDLSTGDLAVKRLSLSL